MAAPCTVCGTENREGARFCKGCGARRGGPATTGTDTGDWAATAPSPLAGSLPADERTMILPAGWRPPVADDQDTAFADIDAGAGREAVAPVPPAPRLPVGLPPAPPAASAAARLPGSGSEAAPAGRSTGLVLGIGALLLALLVGGGGWYALSTRPSTAPAPPAVPAAPAIPAPSAVAPTPATTVEPGSVPAPSAAVPATAAAPEPSAPVLSPQAAAPVAEPAPVPSAAPPVPTPSPAPVPRPRRIAPVAAPTTLAPSAGSASAPAPASIPEAPLPAPSTAMTTAAPQAACAGRNFVAMAQCMASQCARAEFRAHPQCDAVRRQQRLDEEKRNPLLAN